MTIKFSVIIPLFNSSSTIRETLNSVKNQTLDEYEIIIVDDGSNDDSESIVQNFIIENPKIIVEYFYQDNKGVSVARNLAISKAKGEWLAFLDSDDVWHPKKLEIISKYLHKNYSFIGHNFQLANFQTNFDNIKIGNIRVKRQSFYKILLRNTFTTPSVVVKNTSLVFFNEEMKYAEDHELWVRLAFSEPALFLDIPLVKLSRPVLSIGGLSASKMKMRIGEMKMYVKVSKYHRGVRICLPLLLGYSSMKYLLKLFK